MSNFQDTFETRKRPFVSAFSFCMTVPLSSSSWSVAWKDNKSLPAIVIKQVFEQFVKRTEN